MHYPILVNRGTQGKLGQLKILDSRALFFLSSFDQKSMSAIEYSKAEPITLRQGFPICKK